MKINPYRDKDINLNQSMFKRFLFIAIFLTGIAHNCIAQNVTNYTFAASSGTFTALTSAANPTLSGSADDGSFNGIPIGFDFWYMGVRYTTISASTNGWITPGADITDAQYTNDISSGGTPRPVIAPLWDDLNAQAATNVSYKTTGTAGNRVFTVQWLNMKWYYLAFGNSISFQVNLYEGTGKIEFVYRQESGFLSSPSASAGITASATGSGNFRSLSNFGTSPTVSSTIATNSIATKPATGQTYSFYFSGTHRSNSFNFYKYFLQWYDIKLDSIILPMNQVLRSIVQLMG